jgi:cyclic pyranopterin monophosphate synthase
MTEFSHLDGEGRARMVDVGKKGETERIAVAAGKVTMAPETLDRIVAGGVPKGDVLAVARIAGITGAKRTSDLVPLCHPLRITGVEVAFAAQDHGVLEVQATVRALDRTGVEMEALTAVTVAALTVYDMVKALDRSVVLGDIRLLQKAGGKSGDWERPGK